MKNHAKEKHLQNNNIRLLLCINISAINNQHDTNSILILNNLNANKE